MKLEHAPLATLAPLLLVAAARAQVVDVQPIPPPADWSLGEKAQIGYAMAWSGDSYFVTVPGRKGGEGSILRFDRDPASGAWSLAQEIQAAKPKAKAYYGIALDVDGERGVCGEPYRSPGGLHYSGAAYVIERDAPTGDWVQVQRLLPSNPGKDHYFGYAARVVGDTIVVAAPLAGPAQEGILYVFERDAATGKFVERQQLTANLPGPWPMLGPTLAFDGDVLVAGTATFSKLGVTPAVVFRRPAPGAPFALEQQLAAGTQPFNLSLSVAVDTAGGPERILVGSREQVDGMGREGRVYVYEYDAGAQQWGLVQELFPLDTVTEHFGFDVSLRGDRALIGNYYHDVPTAQDGPLTQLALRDPQSGLWSMEMLGDPAPAGTEWLASVVLTTPTTAFAHRGFHSLPKPADVNAFGYFDAPLGVTACPPPTPNSAGLAGALTGLGSADVLADALVAEASALPPGKPGYLLVASGDQGAVVPPGSQGLLCLSGGLGRYTADLQNSGPDGTAATRVDLGAIPQPGGSVAGMAGETWHFQFWYRDTNPTPTSNLTELVSVTLR